MGLHGLQHADHSLVQISQAVGLPGWVAASGWDKILDSEGIRLRVGSQLQRPQDEVGTATLWDTLAVPGAKADDLTTRKPSILGLLSCRLPSSQPHEDTRNEHGQERVLLETLGFPHPASPMWKEWELWLRHAVDIHVLKIYYSRAGHEHLPGKRRVLSSIPGNQKKLLQ